MRIRYTVLLQLLQQTTKGKAVESEVIREKHLGPIKDEMKAKILFNEISNESFQSKGKVIEYGKDTVS